MSLALRALDSSAPGFDADLAKLLAYSAETDRAIEASVESILADVRARGDAAVLEYTRRFDAIEAATMAALEVGPGELAAALAELPAAQRRALDAAAARIRDFHERQLEACGRSWSHRDPDGSLLGQKVTPIERVGIYVPGGKAAYPSSVLMNAIPAKVAGVGEIVMAAPMPGGRAQPARPRRRRARRRRPPVHDRRRAGDRRARLRHGDDPAVHKITGPGNAYVASAKRRVFGTVGIDMIAGPSEILVLADGTTPPDWVAMDLFSQAEHDALAQSILLCPDAAYLDAGARRDRAAAAGAAAPRHHPRLARRAAARSC
jgi:histidinol dehydrogenase